MSDQSISTALSGMTNMLYQLSESITTQTQQHTDLLKKLNTHLTNSQQDIKEDLTHFINNIELTKLINVVNESSQNLQNQKNNIQLLNTKITDIVNMVENSIKLLDEHTQFIQTKLSEDSHSISAQLIQNISIQVRENITTAFTNQFQSQNQKLVFEIKEANELAVNTAILSYNDLIEKVKRINTAHVTALDSFKNQVNDFNKNITQAIKNVDGAFLEVKEKNQKNMDSLYTDCLNFQNKVIEKLNAETDKINQIFDQKISDISIKAEVKLNQSLQKMDQVGQQLDEKSSEITKKFQQNSDKNFGIMQKTIEKQDIYYQNLCDKLKIKYFSINTISFLFVALIVLIGFNIAASMRYSKISDFNTTLVNQNQKLSEDNSKLLVIRNDSIDLTKQSISEVEKKFPNMQVVLNCKSLD